MDLKNSFLVGSVLFLSSSLAHQILSTLSHTLKSLKYRSFSNSFMPNTMVVDCTHTSNTQLTHHLKISRQRQLMDLSLRGDSSTDSVLNCILYKPQSLKEFEYVTCNHFDVDSFFSVWSLYNPKVALQNEYLIRECAKIGDFRELLLQDDTQMKAFKIVCWLNSEEKRLFYRPYDSPITVSDGEEDCDLKFDYFLPRLENILSTIDNPDIQSLYKQEYDRVCAEYYCLHASKKGKDNKKNREEKYEQNMENELNQAYSFRIYPNIGLSVVKAEEPLHYYSLFSCSIGQDIVISIYSNNRYEVETKYTTMVDIISRPTLPRVETTILSKYLNKLERHYCNSNIVSFVPSSNIESMDVSWYGNRMTDSGPLLRLDSNINRLTKAERYGHPYERPIYSSAIPNDIFLDTVISYYEYAYGRSKHSTQSLIETKLDWTWNEIHSFNSAINWKQWKDLDVITITP